MVILSVIGVAIVLVLFFASRGEGYRKKLAIYNRELTSAKQHQQAQEYIVKTLSSELQMLLKEKLESVENELLPAEHKMMVELIIRGCAPVAIESSKGVKSVHDAFFNYLSNTGDVRREDFLRFVSELDDKLKKAWTDNSVEGFIYLCKNLTKN